MPHRTWKIAQIKGHIFGTDGKICSAVVQLRIPNKYLLTRSINHLYPLDIEVPLQPLFIPTTRILGTLVTTLISNY